MPPQVVSQMLRAAADFPRTQNCKTQMVQQENAAGSVTIRRAEGAHINSFRSTVNGMRSRVASPRKNLLRFDHFYDLRFPRIRFRIDNMDAGGTQTGYEQIT